MIEHVLIVYVYCTGDKVGTEILHTLDPSFLSFPALSVGAYTTTLLVMEAVVS